MRIVEDIDIDDIPKIVIKSELCRLAGVSHPTIDSWVRKGKLSKGRKTLANRYWTRDEVIAVLQRVGLIKESAKRK